MMDSKKRRSKRLCKALQNSNPHVKRSNRHKIEASPLGSVKRKFQTDQCLNDPSSTHSENDLQSPPPSEGIIKCAICLDTQDFEEIRSMPCAHNFHRECIETWLMNGDSCPICRYGKGATEYFHIYEVSAANSSEYSLEDMNGVRLYNAHRLAELKYAVDVLCERQLMKNNNNCS